MKLTSMLVLLTVVGISFFRWAKEEGGAAMHAAGRRSRQVPDHARP